MPNIESRIGEYIQYKTNEESYKAYIPCDLPPEPDINMPELEKLHNEAVHCLGKLDGYGDLLPNMGLFIYMYVRREAVLSSQIEGTQSSFIEFVEAENRKDIEAVQGVPKQDVHDISNYVKALNYGLERIKELPLSLRLIREIHDILLQEGRGSTQLPGEFRRSQNWIGGIRPSLAKFVPPPVEFMQESLNNLEKFLHNDRYSPLVKAAIAHVQFETIHPFLDGNGRIGRLLIILILHNEGLLKTPILYISLYLKENRLEYYDLLTYVRETGDWERWINFFLQGIIRASQDAIEKANQINQLFEKHQERIQSKLHKNALRVAQAVYELLKSRVVISLKEAVAKIEGGYTPISNAFKKLEELGIAEECTGKTRNKIFKYKEYANILNT